MKSKYSEIAVKLLVYILPDILGIIHQIFTGYLPYTKHCFRCWGYCQWTEQSSQVPAVWCLHLLKFWGRDKGMGAHALEKRKAEWGRWGEQRAVVVRESSTRRSLSSEGWLEEAYLGRWEPRCKGPDGGACLERSRKAKEATVAGERECGWGEGGGWQRWGQWGGLEATLKTLASTLGETNSLKM